MYYEVLPSKIFRKSPKLEDGILTYAFEEPLNPGDIVSVPLGKNSVLGLVYKKVKKPEGDFKIKNIEKKLYEKSLPSHLLKSIVWLSNYYLVPLPQVVNLFLPNTLEKKHKIAIFSEKSLNIKGEIPLNTAQKRVLKELRASEANTKLLHGITGSGKTNIYLTLAREAIEAKKSVILLVPEIALTSQLVKIFSDTFSENVVLIHSKQTDKTRRETFEKLLNSEVPKIVIGPRSALFAPLKNLGLIIVDEAHESTYFQDQTPKYSALRLASFIAKNLDIPCIFGTATPKIEDYYLAKTNNSLIVLKEKAKDTAITPDIKVVDFKNRENFGKNKYFSIPLLEKIEENLKNGRQTLIYHNRRGSAPLTICEKCGFEALCPNCFLPLTLHADSYKLICHTCGYKEKVPLSCPNCKCPEIIHKGFGTKLLESELNRLFKDAKIARFDGDSEKDKTLDSLYSDVKSGKIDIIIGTQTVAKGLDLPNLATVGIVQADSGLSLPDFSSEERTYDLITQVLGRVGRGHIDEANAIIQTYHPESPAIRCALKEDYEGFYEYMIKKRQKSHLPPFFYLAKLSVVYKTEATTLKKIKEVYKSLKDKNGIYLSAPTPAFHERLSTGFCWQIIVKSSNRKALLDALKSLEEFQDLRISIDPPSLL